MEEKKTFKDTVLSFFNGKKKAPVKVVVEPEIITEFLLEDCIQESTESEIIDIEIKPVSEEVLIEHNHVSAADLRLPNRPKHL